MKNHFTPKEITKILGITYRQTQYWDKTNFIKPSYMRRGKYLLFTFPDLVRLKIAVVLRDVGISLQYMRSIIKQVNHLFTETTSPLDDTTVLIDADSVIMICGPVLMNKAAEIKYIKIVGKTLRQEVDTMFPDWGIDAIPSVTGHYTQP